MKRLFDVFFSISLLLTLSPLMLIIALLILLADGRPVIFRQERIGKDGKEFFIFKYRTMKNSRSKNGVFLSDEVRIFPLGDLLRKLSLDELPQLWNILKGDMSTVGPRALLEEYKDLYTEEEKKRHTIRPGMTGWAQVNGRNSISWKEKFRYDLYYVNNRTFLFDIKILMKTVAVLIRGKGINQSNSTTMEKYNGKN